MRAVYIVSGFVFLGLGIVGYLLPVMPGTIFVILAAGCFAKSSPRFEAWILNHPKFGPAVRGWRINKCIPFKAKLMASGGMALGAVSVALIPMDLKWKAGLWGILAACALYVWGRPSEPVTPATD